MCVCVSLKGDDVHYCVSVPGTCRANSRSRSYGPQMLGFQKGDVLLVTDTCPEGRPGYWYAMKVTSDGHATEGGYISIELT